ncbi:MAG: hypothetical protein ONB23_10225 [candidate division KSB1 bacterium]|nr:hypothetical protein [candidate division KSB1 bacterium]
MRTYAGSFSIFDYGRVKRYPLSTRRNKVKLAHLVQPSEILQAPLALDTPELRAVASHIVEARKRGCPVIWFNGAHLIKNGLGPLVIDLLERGLITHYATNGAGCIHDFELALIGETSENVPNALGLGEFGFAYETGRFLNLAVRQGFARGWGFGESVARLIVGELQIEGVHFSHPEVSVLARAFRLGLPGTVHVGIGTDILHQHPEFDGAATGAASAWDFAIFAATVERMHGGGVFVNVGSAVIGPEVLLKSVSMAANVGKPPQGLVTADFDLRPVRWEEVRDEGCATYYFRDVKSVVTRIPEAFGGRGYYIQGDQKVTIPSLYKIIVEMGT